MSKNKLILFISFMVAALLSILGLYFFQQTISKVMPYNRQEISRICITDGNNGKMIDLEENEIDLLYEELKLIDKKKTSLEESTGWGYDVVIFADNKTMDIVIISPNVWEIDNRSYNITNNMGEKIYNDIKYMMEE